METVTAESEKLHPWRRFFARTVDLLTSGLLLIFAFSIGVGIAVPELVDGYVELLENPVAASIMVYLLWIPVEAAFLAATGTTPAKWIFGIRVLTPAGDRLTYGHALRRTFDVFARGEGLAIPLVTLFTRLIAYNRLEKSGSTPWDESVGSRVVHTSWGVVRATAASLAVVAAFAILATLNQF